MAAKKTSKTNTERKSAKNPRVSVPSYTRAGNKGKAASLPKEIFGQEPNPELLAQAVRVFLANQRRAGAKTKTRGEVSKSKRKIWRQKGLGLARHGSRSAPIFVGGGVAHGPRGNQNYELELPAKMRKKALISALSAKLSAGDIVVADIEKIEPKTKKVAETLNKIGVRKKVTIVHGGSQELWRGARNIQDVSLVPVGQLNAYDVLAAGKLVLTREAVDGLSRRLGEK